MLKYLTNLFLTQKRLLLDKSLPILMNSDSSKNYKNYFSKNILKVKIKNSNQFYSSVQYLYNSFHWQGSTVSTLNHYPDTHGLKMYFPFWNTEVQKFTEKMPENWEEVLSLDLPNFH